MSDMPGQDHLSTHDVTNQPAPRGDLDLWAEDPALGDHAVAAGAEIGAINQTTDQATANPPQVWS